MPKNVFPGGDRQDFHRFSTYFQVSHFSTTFRFFFGGAQPPLVFCGDHWRCEGYTWLNWTQLGSLWFSPACVQELEVLNTHIHTGLSENKVALNSLLNHHIPIFCPSKLSFGDIYTIFRHIHNMEKCCLTDSCLTKWANRPRTMFSNKQPQWESWELYSCNCLASSGCGSNFVVVCIKTAGRWCLVHSPKFMEKHRYWLIPILDPPISDMFHPAICEYLEDHSTDRNRLVPDQLRLIQWIIHGLQLTIYDSWDPPWILKKKSHSIHILLPLMYKYAMISPDIHHDEDGHHQGTPTAKLFWWCPSKWCRSQYSSQPPGPGGRSSCYRSKFKSRLHQWINHMEPK